MHLPLAAHVEIWLWVVLQIVLVVFAIRIYRARRTTPLYLLMWACIAYAFSGLAWYAFYGIRFALHYPMFPTRHLWQAYSDRAFQILFMLLMIAPFRSFSRNTDSHGPPHA